MARQKEEKTKIWRETFERICGDCGLTKTDIEKRLGKGNGWLYHRLLKGYGEFTKMEVFSIAAIVGCTEEELQEIPVAKGKVIPAEDFVTVKKLELDMTELYALLTDGFRMLHLDLQILTETMDKYWKPTEPKYEVKEREQP